MRDILKLGSDFLQDQQRVHMSGEITYTRAEQAVTLLATLGRQKREYLDAQGNVIVAEVRDYLAHAEDLKLGGGAIKPERGDRITEPGGGTYEVQSPPGGGDCWTYADLYRRRIRIHTTKVAE